jgi:NarL family two-component system response regulator LiaR
MERLRILIADDHALVRKAMIALLDGWQDIEVVGEAADGFEVVRLAEETRPDVVLMDLEMPRIDGVAAIRRIKEKKLKSKILVITSYGDEDLVLSAVRAGANGYLLKTTMPDELVSAIREVYRGGAPLDPAITNVVLRGLSGDNLEDNSAALDLTERELTVLRLLAKGHSDRMIADELQISVRTVTTHVQSILRKLGVENRTQAVLYALRNNLADLDD